VGQETAAGWRGALAVASAEYAATPLRAPGPEDPARIGPYRIEAVLGQGGMGRVFLARDSREADPDPVALKVLSRTGDATAWTRFRRELAAARRVAGNGTARVLDGDADADPPWLATEYITGPTLDQLVAARGPLPAAAAAGLAVGVAGALATIHAAGVVHRDLKPANIILAADGPRVVDFGIARTTDATTLSVTGWTMGTPGYMAPEQIADPRSVGPAVDVFALGAVLVFATTALSPYAGGDPASVIYRIVHGAPNLDGVPGELRELVTACLAREPADRPRVESVAAQGLRIVDRLADGATAGPRAQNGPTTALSTPTAVVSGLSRAAAAGFVSDSSDSSDSAAPDSSDPVAPQTPAALSAGPDSGPSANGAELTVVTEVTPAHQRDKHPTADHPRTGRPRRRALGLLAVLVVAALGVTTWFAVQAIAHPASPGAVGSATHSATGTASHTTATTTAAVPPLVLLAGPGCASSPWTVFFDTSSSLEKNVGGGDPTCGGQADAFHKSGISTESGGRAVWRFTFKRSVRCSLQIYVANADPSSGIAVYQLTADGATQTFNLSQATNKGQFATADAASGITAPDGAITLTLTDISANPGDQNHVTASAVSVSCQLT